MKLNLYISVIRADETVHIINGEQTMFFGTIRDACDVLPSDYYDNAEVIDVFTGFSGLCIEAVI